MRTVTRKVYFCDFCTKHNLSAGSIARHEKFCSNRPENRAKCFDMCRNLKRTIRLVDGRDPSTSYSYKTVFTCLITGKEMYSNRFQKKANFKPVFIEGLEKMPTECSDHKYMTENEVEERFNPSQEEF
jgi:hypothetical protein